MTYNVIQGRGFWHKIESAYWTSSWLSIVTKVTLVLSCHVSEILQLLYTKSPFSIPLLYSCLNFGVFPLEQTH